VVYNSYTEYLDDRFVIYLLQIEKKEKLKKKKLKPVVKKSLNKYKK